MRISLSDVIKKFKQLDQKAKKESSKGWERILKGLEAVKEADADPDPIKKFRSLEELENNIKAEKKETLFWELGRKANLYTLSKCVQAFKNDSKKLLYDTATDDLVQGPRMISDATLELQALVNGLLKGNEISFRYNSAGELEIKIDDIEYNLTDILKHQPDFEHLNFSPEELDQYVNLLRANNCDVDMPKAPPYLHTGEKAAIQIYTSNYYEDIQSFLRNGGTLKQLKKIQDEDNASDMLKELKILLLTVCVASHGLSKPQNLGKDKDDLVVLRRGEQDNTNMNESRAQDMKSNKAITRNVGFTSSSSEDTVGQFKHKNTEITYIQPKSGIAKSISRFSRHSDEKEGLFTPGTQFKIIGVDSLNKRGKTEVLAVPVRTITNIPEAKSYSIFKAQKKSLNEIQNQLQDIEKEIVNIDQTNFRQYEEKLHLIGNKLRNMGTPEGVAKEKLENLQNEYKEVMDKFIDRRQKISEPHQAKEQENTPLLRKNSI